MRKNIYKWHRSLSLIIAIPVVLWAVSGFLHPIMTNVRPKVATQWIAPMNIDSNKIKLPLQNVLLQNGIDSFQSVRIIHIDTNYFYQVKLLDKSIQYYSAYTGKQLIKGDWLYAQYLARIFLEGQKNDTAQKSNIAIKQTNETAGGDCCSEAAACVLKPTSGAPFSDVQKVNSFDAEYKNINRILPVYKVAFERNDNIRIYVETEQDRFCLAVDKNRAWFSKFFSLVHNMEWLSVLGKGRIYIELTLIALTFLTTIMGIWIFFITKSKKVKDNSVIKARRNHRYTAVVFSFFTLMFTFSGGFHAFSKLKEDTRDRFFAEQHYASSTINFNLSRLSSVVKKQISNIGLVTLDTSRYWQVYIKDNPNKMDAENKSKDLMKSMTATVPEVIYINTESNQILPEGERKYAEYLANNFSKKLPENIIAAKVITKFEGEYGFVNKRLPVWRIDYNTNNNERFYVETATGKLSVRIDDQDLREANIFNYLHKHHFMDFAGKSWRDFSTMFWVASQIAMVFIGFILYLRTKKNKQHNLK